MIPSPDTARPVDGSDHTTIGMTGPGGFLDALFDRALGDDSIRVGPGLDDITPEKALQLAQEAQGQAQTYVQQTVRAYWARSQKAFQNKHFDGSKYHSHEYRGRSKLFRPKTRTAVFKKMATAAQALYSTSDVISVQPQDESDDYQVASAQLKQQVLNYRFSRVSRRNGIPWFLVSMGAVQTAMLTGLIISKQTWVYREDHPDAANPNMPGMAGPGKPPVIEDRPDIQLLPPENVLFDPNCDWTRPAQSSQYIIIRYPMSVDEAWGMIQKGTSAGDMRFLRSITRQDVASKQQTIGPADTAGVRTAREGGRDPKQQASGSFGRVWLYEVFMRIGGLDVVYWTLDNQQVISEIVPVRRAYPAFGGERPVVIGYGSLEAFRPMPMSPVESWQQMQMEANDQVNLRLDHMKNVVTPAAKVVRGKNVDLNQVNARGPNRVVLVNDAADVEYWEPPDLPQSAFVENNMLTADFDSLAGVFDASSVNSNRQLNETVGGMRLLANSVNPMADFELNVLVETWAEPVLWQIMKLEEMYESDAVVLALCGQKAKLWERFGINQITDELLNMDSTLTIKLGVGATNLPHEKIQKFSMAWGTAQQALAPFVQAGQIAAPKPRVKEIIETIFSSAGFSDAGERFFQDLETIDSMPPQPPPGAAGGAAEAQAKSEQAQVAREKAQLDFHAKMEGIKQKKAEIMARVETEHMRALAEIGRAYLDAHHNAEAQARDHMHDHLMSERGHEQGVMRDQIGAAHAAAQRAAAPPPQAR